jgi:AcrR family transcriptional regulator
MARTESKRELILDLAEQGILQKGFSATSIDEIIFEAKISKNGFFYHFKDKNELAKALLQRYIDNEDAILDSVFLEGKERYQDPLDALLCSLELLAKMMDDLPTGHPGCLVATLAYSEKLHDVEVRELNKHAVVSWRERFLIELKRISDIYPAQDDVKLRSVADMISSAIEGGIVLSRALNEPKVLGDQIRMLASYVKLLFPKNRT